MAHFEIKNLSFSYPTAKGKESLKEVNLTIQKGEYLVLCGKSGSGKTTLLRHLKPVLAPHGKHTGEILFNGIPMEQVMACGDSENDIEMLRAAGLGIAMANSTPEALAAADAVTLSNEEHGVAAAIKRYALHQYTI